MNIKDLTTEEAKELKTILALLSAGLFQVDPAESLEESLRFIKGRIVWLSRELQASRHREQNLLQTYHRRAATAPVIDVETIEVKT